jgi:hypothetical protein
MESYEEHLNGYQLLLEKENMKMKEITRARDVNERELNELERPSPRSFNLTRQQSLDQEKRNLEQTLEDKRKELEKINQYSHSLKDLGSKKSKNEHICVELVNYRKKAEKEQQGVEKLNEEIEKLLL